jgi:hypothetical protein
MKTLLSLACLCVLGAAQPAHAATALGQLERKVAAYATPYLDVFKGLCTCTDGGTNDGRAGRLRYAIFDPPSAGPELKVWCQVSVYDASGDPESSVGCWTFQPIAK